MKRQKEAWGQNLVARQGKRSADEPPQNHGVFDSSLDQRLSPWFLFFLVLQILSPGKSSESHFRSTDEAAADTCHAAEVLILCHYETHQGNDAHEHLLYHHSCLCHNLFIFLLFILCFLNHDAKLRTFWLQFFNSSIFQFFLLRRIYKICDRNGNPCHNCRKTHKKVSLTPLDSFAPKNSEGTRIAASPFTVMDTYSALWLINAIIVLRLEFRIPC